MAAEALAALCADPVDIGHASAVAMFRHFIA